MATVVDTVVETARATTLLLDVEGWPGHRAGQHVDVRLTAEDGYQANRSYSLASAPDSERLAITVERIDDGEVSPYLTQVAEPGDQVEVRGPIGGHFVWDGEDDQAHQPVLLVAGGSGVVPLMAMVRHRARRRLATPMRLAYSARTAGDVLYAEELAALATSPAGPDVHVTLTRGAPPGWSGGVGRLDAARLAALAWPDRADQAAFLCGPNGFVESAARHLVDLGLPRRLVKTERFGPSR